MTEAGLAVLMVATKAISKASLTAKGLADWRAVTKATWTEEAKVASLVDLMVQKMGMQMVNE